MTMSKKQTKSEPSPIEQAEATLVEARADLERAQAAILEADPGEVIACRDRALVCEAAVRKAERALQDARDAEATRDRRRVSELASLTDASASVHATLRSHADAVARAQAQLVSALREGVQAAQAFDQRAKAAADLASALDVSHTPARVCVGLVPAPGDVHSNTHPGGVWRAILHEVLFASGVAPIPFGLPLPAGTENEMARAVCNALAIPFPDKEILAEFRGAGVSDQLIVDMAWSGALERYYSERRQFQAARKEAEARRGLSRWRDAIQRDVAPHSGKSRRKGDPVSEFAHATVEKLKGGWQVITSELVHSVRTHFPKGFAAGVALDPTDIDRPLPVWDARARLTSLGAALAPEVPTAAE
jgi:hypothetical protein